ncbi:hypothetical protein KXV85_005726, partial [Aspergillus fumigatus]
MAVGGYRFLAQDLQEWAKRLGQGALLTALPDRMSGHRLAGRAPDNSRAREALSELGLNPLMPAKSRIAAVLTGCVIQMSQQGPILVVSTGRRPSFASALHETKLFPVGDAEWTDAARAVAQVRPSLVLAANSDTNKPDLESLAKQ